MNEAIKWDGSAERIAEEIQGKDYIILKLSEYLTGHQADVSLLAEPEEIMEAHFFDEESWIHIYEYDGELWMNRVHDEAVSNQEDNDYIEERQSLRTKSMAQTLVCRKNIAYDDYGQAYFASMRPVRICDGNNQKKD